MTIARTNFFLNFIGQSGLASKPFDFNYCIQEGVRYSKSFFEVKEKKDTYGATSINDL